MSELALNLYLKHFYLKLVIAGFVSVKRSIHLCIF